MSTRFLLLSVVFATIVFASCKKNLKEVDANGLTEEINNLVPDSILQEMQALGMPINGGATPPNLQGTFLASPFILLSSNRPGDTPGSTFVDYEVTFSDQNNEELTIMLDYVNGPEKGTGLGSFIVGTNREFSVFVEVLSTFNGATPARFIHVISGTRKNNGIEDLFYANFMLDDGGDPNSVWIENGDGRVIYDEDGFSEKQ